MLFLSFFRLPVPSRRRLLCALLFFILAPGLRAAEPAPTPRRLSAVIGGFLGKTYRVELEGEKLIYTVLNPGNRVAARETITPKPAQWTEFWRTLDEIGVWRWHSEYLNPAVLDGTQWSLDLAEAGHAVKAHGSNTYPEADARPSRDATPTKTFNHYLAALRTLLDNRPFE